MSDKAKDKNKKVKGFKEFDPGQYIDVEPRLEEAKKGTAVFAWGRMNPVTAGHEKLVKKVISVARSEKGMPHIFLTHSFDKKKNPLAYGDKIRFAQKAFGPVVKKSDAKTIFQLMKQLERNFNRVVLIAGSDRIKDFESTLNKYNGKEYNFDEIKVVSAGMRDADSDSVEGISGTKMRGYAASDMKKFQSNLPAKLQGDAEEIAKAVRKGMNMSENNESFEGEQLDEILNRQQRRKRGLLMKRMKHKIKRGQEKAKHRTATMDTLKKRARKQAIMNLKQRFSKNRRFAELSAGEKEVIEKRISKISKKRIEMMARKLLPSVKQKERDRRKSMVKKEDVDLNSRFETFMEDYYKGVPKNKKDDREAHFKKHAEKPGDGADKDSNYKDAPGDIGKDGERVKTKVSKHTKKYQQMYGEDLNEWVCGSCHAEPCMCEGDGAESLHEMWGSYVTKRPHMLMDKNGKVKFDKRFKMYKQKPELQEELVNLIESTEDYALDLNEDPTASLKKKAEKTGMPMGVLRQVYNRGVAAWKSGHRPGTTPEQWGHARVNSFVTKSSGTWGKADSDLAAKVRGSKKEEVEMDEAHDPKHVKMAVGIASDKRYAGGNMTGAVKQIDKIKKGLSNHPQVRAVLKRQNEELINKLDEAIMSNQLDELTAAEKKLVNQMYDKKGNLTPLGKKVMNHGKKKGDKGFVESLDDRFEAFMAESIDEVLDTPKAMDSYRNKAKYSKDKAGNSAMATVLRGDGDGKKDLKTMSKRTKGLKMADRNATKKTFKALRAGYSEDLDEDAKMKKQSDDNLKSLHKQFKGQDQKMPSTQHMMKRITKEMKRRNMSESEEVEINETTVSATKKPVNITGPDGKTRTVMKSTRSKQTDDRGQDKIKTNEEETLATNANKELQDREKKEKIVKRSKREMKKKDDAEIESKARRDGGPADVSEEGGAGDQGTDKLVNKYKKDTPNC